MTMGSFSDPSPQADFEPTLPRYGLEPSRAGFWRRAVAYLIDFLIIELIVIFFTLIGAIAIEAAQADGSGMSLSAPPLIESYVPLFTSIFLSYFSFFTYWGGQTPGKLLLRLRVVTQELDDLSFLRSLGRSLSYFLSSLFLGAGFLMAGVDRNKRALHDWVAGTWVVKV